MRVAAIDCGTNSVRLLIAEPAADGGLTELARQLHVTRLGQGVDATRRFHPEALERTFAALREYAGVIASLGVEKVAVCATSAARDVSNAQEFSDGVKSILGVAPSIISGQTEARLSWLGARSGLPGVQGAMLVVDIGGGSTELVLGDGDDVRASVSLDIGSVRLRERFLRDLVPSAGQIAEATAYVDAMLDECPVPLAEAKTWVGVAGTATSLSAMLQGLTTYDRALVHGSELTWNQIQDLTTRLLSMSPQQTVEAFPSLPMRRAEVICAGALICQRVGLRLSTQAMVISENDILDGIALALWGDQALD